MNNFLSPGSGFCIKFYDECKLRFRGTGACTDYVSIRAELGTFAKDAITLFLRSLSFLTIKDA